MTPEAIIAEAKTWNGQIRKSFIACLKAVLGTEGDMIAYIEQREPYARSILCAYGVPSPVYALPPGKSHRARA